MPLSTELGAIIRVARGDDLRRYGNAIRNAATIYARDKAASSPRAQLKQIQCIAHLIDRSTRHPSAFEELSRAIEALDPAVRRVWELRQSAVAHQAPSLRIPDAEELRNPATRDRAICGLRALITVGGAWGRGRRRASGRRSLTWQTRFQAPVSVPGKRLARREAERTLVMNLQVAVLSVGVHPPATAHPDKPGPFARMVAEILQLLGATGSGSATGLAVQIINDLQAERRARLQRTPVND